RALLLEARLPPSVVPGEVAHPRKLVADVVKRREVGRERLQRLARSGHVLQLRGEPLGVALQSLKFGLRHAKVAFEALRLLALALRLGPPRGERVDGRLEADALRLRPGDPRGRLALAYLRLDDLRG